MRARYYSTALRRFVNADKVHGDITNALTLNRYAYCNSDPANGIDPTGFIKERGGAGSTVSKTKYLPYNMLYIRPIVFAYSNIENNKKVKRNSNSLSKLYQFLYKSSNFISSLFVGYSYNNDEVKSRFINNSNLKVETNPDINIGIINNQHTQLLHKYAFGNSTISDAGCEAIAVYNSLYNLGSNDVKLSEIIYNIELENAMLNGGEWGCNPYSLERVMNKYNVNMNEVDFEEANQKGDYIFSYITDDTNGELFRSVHTVAAHYDGNNYTVYNNLSGKSIGEEHYKNLNEFANNYICGFYLNSGE